MMGVIIGIFIINLTLLAHELGHYVIAKFNKVKVIEFNVGMGPLLYKKKTKDTAFVFRVFPFGGSCIFSNSEDNKAINEDEKFYESKSLGARAAIIAGGPFFSLLFVFILIFFFGSGSYSTIVKQVIPGSPMEKVGVRQGDIIIEANQSTVEVLGDLISTLNNQNEEFVQLTIERNSRLITKIIELDNDFFSQKENFHIVPLFYDTGGIIPYRKQLDLGERIVNCTHSLYFLLKNFFDITRNIIIGENSNNNSESTLAGSLGIITIYNESFSINAHYDLMYAVEQLMILVIAISFGIALFNLLPYPTLDGGQLLLLGIEAIRGKPINRNLLKYITLPCEFLIILFIIYILIKDIFRLF